MNDTLTPAAALKLDTWVQHKIRHHANLILALSLRCHVIPQTMKKYIERNDAILCEDYCLKLIAEYLVIDQEVLTVKRSSDEQ